MKDELDTLRQFKEDAEAAEAKAKRDAVFALFTDLEGIEAFDTLRENCADMTEDDLKKECFAIRGEYGVQVKFSADKQQKAPKQKVVENEPEDEAPYGGIVEELGRK